MLLLPVKISFSKTPYRYHANKNKAVLRRENDITSNTEQCVICKTCFFLNTIQISIGGQCANESDLSSMM